jgi:hypothetical protein
VTIYRPADLSPDAEERAFVISAWSSSYKSSHFAGLIASEDWATIMHVQIGKLIARPTVRTIIACDPPSSLYGFIVGDTAKLVPLDLHVQGHRTERVMVPVVHYVYVKDPYRSEDERGGSRAGPRYARGLFAALGVDPMQPFAYTCRTAIVARLADKIPRARLMPAAARYFNYQEDRHGNRRP